MNVSKKSFIAFAVLACCFGASTLGTHVDASYGYKYTDSVRPPVETPTNDAFRANMVKQNEADNAKYAATTNTSTASAKDDDSIYYVSDLSESPVVLDFQVEQPKNTAYSLKGVSVL